MCQRLPVTKPIFGRIWIKSPDKNGPADKFARRSEELSILDYILVDSTSVLVLSKTSIHTRQCPCAHRILTISKIAINGDYLTRSRRDRTIRSYN